MQKTDLFVEIDPNQKERIVEALRRRGHVVGYLGDGINDAPALHEADVGISVDGAVDVAREAADMVLVQRDLGVLLRGIDDGRKTFANTMKYIAITTSANFGNMVSMAIASLVLPFLPLLAPQILLNNLLSDLPALAIATDNVDPEEVHAPRLWDIGFVRRFMITLRPDQLRLRRGDICLPAGLSLGRPRRRSRPAGSSSCCSQSSPSFWLSAHASRLGEAGRAGYSPG